MVLWTSLQSNPVWTSRVSCHKTDKAVTCVIVSGVRTVGRESELQDSPGGCRREDKKPTERGVRGVWRPSRETRVLIAHTAWRGWIGMSAAFGGTSLPRSQIWLK